MVEHGSDLMGLGSDIIESGSGLVVGIGKKVTGIFYYYFIFFTGIIMPNWIN